MRGYLDSVLSSNLALNAVQREVLVISRHLEVNTSAYSQRDRRSGRCVVPARRGGNSTPYIVPAPRALSYNSHRD